MAEEDGSDVDAWDVSEEKKMSDGHQQVVRDAGHPPRAVSVQNGKMGGSETLRRVERP